MREQEYIDKSQGSLYQDMGDKYILDELSIQQRENSKFDRLTSFEGMGLKTRWELKISAHDGGGEEDIMDDMYSIDFYSTKTDPKEAVKELLDHVEVSLYVDGLKNKQNRLITGDFDNIDLEDTAMFMKLVNPELESISIEKIPLVDKYKYLHYQNLKWANEMLVRNFNGWTIADGFVDLKDTIYKELDIPNDTENPMIKDEFIGRNNPVIMSVLEGENDPSIPPSSRRKI